MSLIVFSRIDSPLHLSACAHSFEDAIRHLPDSTTLILPSSSHINRSLGIWARIRTGEPLPEIVTMSGFVSNLFKQIKTKDEVAITDVESELILDISLRNIGEQFLPSGFSVNQLVRWKQEMHTVQEVTQLHKDDEMPKRLNELNRILKIWTEYEHCKGLKYLDRGDVVHRVIDAIATGYNSPAQQHVLVLYTHGLTSADRTLFALLAKSEWDIGIRFSHTQGLDDRSRSSGTWLVSIGWHAVEVEQAKGDVITFLRKWPDQREEVKRVLGATRELMSQGADVSDIAIIVPRSGSYDQLLTEYAASAQIPISYNINRRLEHDGNARAILAACHVVSRHWRRSDVERLIRSGYVKNQDVHFGAIYECGVASRIPGGNGWQDWKVQFEKVVAALRSSGDNDDDSDVKPLIHLFTEGIRAIEILSAVIDVRKEFLTPAEFVSWIQNRIIRGLGFEPPEQLVRSLEMYQRTAARHVHTDTQLADHINRWFRIVGTFDTEDVSLRFKGLFIGKPQEIRGMLFRYVFALGFIEDELPAPVWDAINEELLAGIRESMDKEALSDILSSVEGGGTIVISRPAMVEDVETVDSIFIDDIISGASITNSDEKSGYQSLDTNGRVVISPAEILAYRNHAAIDSADRQKGVKREALATQVSTEFDNILNAPISPSRLDTVSACPYRFFVKYGLRVKSNQTMDEILSPIDRGSLMHSVAHTFFRKVRGHETSEISSVEDVRNAMVDLTTKSTEEWLPLLQNIYEEERTKFPGGYLYDEVEREMMYDSNHRAGLLHRWLNVEMMMQQKTSFRPAFFEFQIDDEISIGCDSNIAVNLRIDRVDVAIRDDEIYCVVIDYKTADQMIPKRSEILEGIKSQMPLYAQALKTYFGKYNLKCAVSEGSYHTFGKSIKDSDNPKIRVPIKAEQEFEVALSNTVHYVDLIKSGTLPVIPLPGACIKCDVKEVCRVEHWGPSLLKQLPIV